MSDIFLEKIDSMLESKKNFSLSVLIEEKESKKIKKSKKPKKSKEELIFDAFDDSEENDSQQDDLGSEEDVLDSEEDVLGSEEDETEEKSTEDTSSGEDVYADLSTLDKYVKDVEADRDIKTTLVNKYSFSPESIIENKTVKNELLTLFDLMLLKEEDENIEKTLDKVEKSLEAEKERIEKLGDEANRVSSKIKAGIENINVEEEVKDALHKFKYFDKLFSKAEIVANMYIKKIADLSSPQEAEKNVKEFLDNFNKALPKESKLSIQMEPSSYNTAVGGKTST